MCLLPRLVKIPPVFLDMANFFQGRIPQTQTDAQTRYVHTRPDFPRVADASEDREL